MFETTITLADFLTIPIVAVGMSLILQGAKQWAPMVSARVLTVVAAVMFGSIYYLVADTSWFASFLGMLGAASTFYAFFLKSDNDGV